MSEPDNVFQMGDFLKPQVREISESLKAEALPQPPDRPISRRKAGAATVNDITREEIDAKIAASEARGDVRFVELKAHIDAQGAAIAKEVAVMSTRLGGVEGYVSGLKSTVIITGVSIFFGVAALLVAVLAYGGQWFGLGLDTSQVVDQAADRAIARYAEKAAAAAPVVIPTVTPSGKP
jgi:hypothetical protein